MKRPGPPSIRTRSAKAGSRRPTVPRSSPGSTATRGPDAPLSAGVPVRHAHDRASVPGARPRFLVSKDDMTMERVIDRTYRIVRFVLDWGVGYGAAIVLLGATCFAISAMIRRYLFGVVSHWGQDAVTYLLAGSVFLFFPDTPARQIGRASCRERVCQSV